MIKVFLTLLAAVWVLVGGGIVAQQQAAPAAGGGSGTISTLDQWKSDGTNITQRTANKPVKITGLESKNCIGTDSSGVLQTGTCTGGSGGGLASSSPWTPGNLTTVLNDGSITSIASSSLDLPNSALQNSAVTINGTSISLGGSDTITAASSTLLSNNNTFSGTNTFSNAPVLSSLSSTFLAANPSGTIIATTTPVLSLDGLTAPVQTFSHSDDTNVSLSISTTGGTNHVFTSIWNGILAVARGGTGSSTLSGILKGNGTSAVQTAVPGTDYQTPITLTTTGSSGAATFDGTTLNVPNYTTGSSFAYPFPNNATSTALTFSGGVVVNAASSTLAGSAETSTTTITQSVIFKPVGNFSNSESVGGPLRADFSGANTGFHITSNNTSSGPLLDIDFTGATANSQPFRIESTATNQSTLNIQGMPRGLGVIKASAQGDQGNDGAIISIDSTTNGNSGQGLFIKCNSATTTACLDILDSGSNTVFKVDGNKLVRMLGNSTTTGQVEVDSLAASSLVRTDANKTLSNVTVGSGLSFDGTTLSATGGSSASSTLLGDNNTFSGSNIFSSAPKLGSLTGVVVANSGTLFATASSSLNLPNTALQNSSVTVNGTSISLGGSGTVTAASSTLLSNNNTFSGNNTFSNTITGSITGNAGTVTNGVYTTDTGTVTNTMLAGSIANSKLLNSSFTLNGTSVALGDTKTITAASSSILGDANTFSGINNFSNSSSVWSGKLGSLTGLVKAASGVLSAAANGTDYTLINGTTCGGTDKVSAVAADGTVTCSADQTGGGSSFAYPFPSDATSTQLTFSNAGGIKLTGLSAGGLAIDSTGATYSFSTSTWRFASSTLLSDNNTFSGVNAFTATTSQTAAQIGSTANTSNILTFSPLSGLTTSNSESVGGLLSGRCGTGDVLCAALYASTTGSQRTLSVINNGFSFSGNVLHVRNNGTASAVNVLGHPQGKGIVKIASDGAGDANASVLSLDGSTSSFLGQTFFAKCGTATDCLVTLDSGSNSLLRLQSGGNFGLSVSNPTYKLDVAGLGHFTGLVDADHFVATSSTVASSLPYASSTALTVSGTAFIGSGSGLLQTTSGTVSNYGSTGLVVTTSGVPSAYAGATCTNQFVRALSASGAATCATVGAADVSLANLTATDSTLTFSGTYNGSTARTIGLNLANANTWTGTPTFSNVTYSGLFTGGPTGIGTSTPAQQYQMTIASSTAAQLLLSSGAGDAGWVARADGGHFFLASTTIAGTATTSTAAISIDDVGTTTLRNTAGFDLGNGSHGLYIIPGATTTLMSY